MLILLTVSGFFFGLGGFLLFGCWREVREVYVKSEYIFSFIAHLLIAWSYRIQSLKKKKKRCSKTFPDRLNICNFIPNSKTFLTDHCWQGQSDQLPPSFLPHD